MSEIRILEQEKITRRDDVYSAYPQGMILYYHENEGDNSIVIKGEQDYDAMHSGPRFGEPSEGRADVLKDCERLVVKPLPKSDVSLRPQLVLSEEKFWSEAFAGVVRANRDEYRKYYKAESRNMKIYFYLDTSLTGRFDGIIVYGTAIEDVDLNEINKALGVELSCMSCDEYLSKMCKRRRSKLGRTRRNEEGKTPAVAGAIKEWVEKL